MKRITLRLPDDLHDAIGDIAEKEDRSLNAQIVNAIKYYIDMDRRRDLVGNAFEEMRARAENLVDLDEQPEG